MGMKILDVIWNIGSNCRWYVDRFLAAIYAKAAILDKCSFEPFKDLMIYKEQIEAARYAVVMLRFHDRYKLDTDHLGKYDLYKWSYLRRNYPEFWKK
nr:MAG TPA: hypothetical protein [Caudoviricetes sp.]